MNRLLCFILTFYLLISPATYSFSLSFHRVGFIQKGIIMGYGYIRAYDANRDGFVDLVFSTPVMDTILGIAYWGCRPYNRFLYEDSIMDGSCFWDISDGDSDSLSDIVTDIGYLGEGDSVKIYESPDRFSFPREVVWGWEFEYFGNWALPMYFTDLDQDGRKEILFGDLRVVYVFENMEDNQYQKVFSDTNLLTGMPMTNWAFNDFDGDGRTEFVTGAISRPPNVFVYECTGDNQYRMVFYDTIVTRNCGDIIAIPDIDRDGKPEFMVGSVHNTPSGFFTALLTIYESTGNNEYEKIYQDSIPHLDFRRGYVAWSDCGDVDNDGEIELIWAIDRDWLIYKATGNNQFQRVYRAYGDNGRNTTIIHIYDLNQNGYPEIIESGGNETRIWEIEAVRIQRPNGGEVFYSGTQEIMRWQKFTPPGADSFSIFYSYDNGRNYNPIVNGISGQDTTFLWTVPNTISDSCKIMIWAYGPGTGWDFSDANFRIEPGVEISDKDNRSKTIFLDIKPNPIFGKGRISLELPVPQEVSLKVYNVSGQLVNTLINRNLHPGRYEILWHPDNSGIYFLILNSPVHSVTKRVVVLAQTKY